jgi:transposase
MQIATIGLDLAKHVFQLHGVGPDGCVILRRKLRRTHMMPFFASLPPCLIGMEACASAHYWARELSAFGHEVRLMPAHYVKAHVKRGKNDAADAEVICEAVTRPTMRFVAIKTKEQQAVLVMHRARDLLVRQGGTRSLRLFGITSSRPKNSILGFAQSATRAPPGQVSLGRRVIGTEGRGP